MPVLNILSAVLFQLIYLYTYKILAVLLAWLRPCVDSIIKGLSRPVLKVSRIIVPPVNQLLRSKWLNFFSRCTERKIDSFWPKKLGQIFVPPVTNPGSKEKLGQRRSYIASVVWMTLATNVGSTFILWKSSLPCIPTLGWRQNPRSFRPLDVGPTSQQHTSNVSTTMDDVGLKQHLHSTDVGTTSEVSVLQRRS